MDPLMLGGSDFDRMERRLRRQGGRSQDIEDRPARRRGPSEAQENLLIAANRSTPAAQAEHDFRLASWTDENGEGRCLLCGSREATDADDNTLPCAGLAAAGDTVSDAAPPPDPDPEPDGEPSAQGALDGEGAPVADGVAGEAGEPAVRAGDADHAGERPGGVAEVTITAAYTPGVMHAHLGAPPHFHEVTKAAAETGAVADARGFELALQHKHEVVDGVLKAGVTAPASPLPAPIVPQAEAVVVAPPPKAEDESRPTKKYSDDQARDDHGMWAAGTEAGTKHLNRLEDGRVGELHAHLTEQHGGVKTPYQTKETMGQEHWRGHGGKPGPLWGPEGPGEATARVVGAPSKRAAHLTGFEGKDKDLVQHMDSDHFTEPKTLNDLTSSHGDRLAWHSDAHPERAKKSDGPASAAPPEPTKKSLSQLLGMLVPQQQIGDYKVVAKSEGPTAEEHRTTLGIVYPVDRVDAHGDRMTADEIRKAAWGWAKKGFSASGTQHRTGTGGAGVILESYLWPDSAPNWEIARSDGTTEVVKSGDWLAVVQWDAPTWDDIKKGRYTGYSLQGMGKRVADEA